MKKLVFSAIIVIATALSSQAQDTTIVQGPVKFVVERFKSETSDSVKTYYTAIIDGKNYPTTKVAANRYAIYSKYGSKALVAIITSKNGKTKRVITL